MTPEAIAAVFTGLTGLVAALAAFTANRSKKIGDDQRAMRKRLRKLERQYLGVLSHIFVLELEIARLGGSPPDRPPILEEMDDADEDDDDAPPNRGGSHRA